MPTESKENSQFENPQESKRETIQKSKEYEFTFQGNAGIQGKKARHDYKVKFDNEGYPMKVEITSENGDRIYFSEITKEEGPTILMHELVDAGLDKQEVTEFIVEVNKEVEKNEKANHKSP